MTDRPHDRPENLRPAEASTRDRSPDDERVWVPWSEIELPDEPEPKAAEEVNGWDAPGLADNPDRPDPRDIHLPDDRRTHILDGDPRGLSGGHRHGTGHPDKTEYPERWDDDTACAYVLDVARNPDREPYQQVNRRWECVGVRDRVELHVIVWPEGKIWTSWPAPGGDGVAYNPPKERP